MHSSPKTKTRSSLTIDAVATAAAQGAATALLPHRRIGAIAGLAGFVLRLFRRSLTAPSGAGATVPRRYPGAKAALERSRSGADTKPERSRSGADTKPKRSRSGAGAEKSLRALAAGAGLNPSHGGLRHG